MQKPAILTDCWFLRASDAKSVSQNRYFLVAVCLLDASCFYIFSGIGKNTKGKKTEKHINVMLLMAFGRREALRNKRE
ncbi:MAG: hypothetical protein ACLVKK_02755 [Ruthenibacterium sp.]